MEFHSPTAAKRFWRILRVAFFMMRKGLISKRKMLMDMNLMMKRGKLIGKSLGRNLMAFHPHRQRTGLRGEYEFSCSNSPNPVFFHGSRRRGHNYFPCIKAIVEEMDDTPRQSVVGPPRIEYSPSQQSSSSSSSSSSSMSQIITNDLAPGEDSTLMMMPSPLSVRVSNYSSEMEVAGSGQEELDYEAEEFIRRFYEQLASAEPHRAAAVPGNGVPGDASSRELNLSITYIHTLVHESNLE